ncbi:MAG: hypothetical protein SVZ03_02090 [Spirochaetota bacterium]|nr:hypothetical protein [Spirochaetota bacterium]
MRPLLDEIPNKKITNVVAGAGFGKTTLIAQACMYSKVNTVWYRLDKSDKNFITFLSYLIAGIGKYFPEFGIETHQKIEDS